MADSVKDTFQKLSNKKNKEDGVDDLLMLDVELGLYELTEMFHTAYKYHNQDCLIEYTEYVVDGPQVSANRSNLSRFEGLRRIQAAAYGSRPFPADADIAVHKPNNSYGYMKLFLRYAVLPFQSVFTDSGWCKIQINRRLYNALHLSDQEKQDAIVQGANNPTMVSNNDISEDVSDTFVEMLKLSKKVKSGVNAMPWRIKQDGLIGFIHGCYDDWEPEHIPALDLVTPPQVGWDTSEWNHFFVIRKLEVADAIKHIRDKTEFWNGDALRWALQNARDNRGMLGGSHYRPKSDSLDVGNENFCVRSYYNDKSSRSTSLHAYYGTMLVVEGYYLNKSGKVDKVIFFPSQDYKQFTKKNQPTQNPDVRDAEKIKKHEKADILFFYENAYPSMQQAATIIPYDRSDPSLERQRGDGHELFSVVEAIMRQDSSIANVMNMLGLQFYNNPNQGNNSQSTQDLEVGVRGDMVNLGDRVLQQTYLQGDLNSMLGSRRTLIQHAMSIIFAAGLDSGEKQANGRGYEIANLMLIRDGRVHKHIVEYFGEGLKELFTKTFVQVLNLMDDLSSDARLVQRLFFDVLFNLYEYPKDYFQFKEKDVLPDTGLPYWITVESIRNGASHFGAAEHVLYAEVMNTYAGALDQAGIQALSRKGLKASLGSQDSMDILGDPKEKAITDEDQVYEATRETVELIGSVDGGALSFEAIPVRALKDNHVIHLSKSHNPKMQEYIKALQENEVTPQILQEMSEQDLESRNVLILKLNAVAAHCAGHLNNLERYGSKRDDINRLKEETNAFLQSAEGLMNSLQLNLRVLTEKRQEQLLKLQNLSPENEAEKAKQEKEVLQLQAKMQGDREKLALANKIADNQSKQHLDNQLTKARDRELKRKQGEQDVAMRKQEIEANVRIAEAKKAEKKAASAK